MTVHVSAEMREKVYRRSRGLLELHAGWSWTDATIQAFAEVLSEEPIVPTEQQWRDMETEVGDANGWGLTSLRGLPKHAVVEWQRRMFALPESEVPEEKKYTLESHKCPHRWSAYEDRTTMESVVSCELCGWEYSRTALILCKSGGAKGAKR